MDVKYSNETLSLKRSDMSEVSHFAVLSDSDEVNYLAQTFQYVSNNSVDSSEFKATLSNTKLDIDLSLSIKSGKLLYVSNITSRYGDQPIQGLASYTCTK